MKKLVLVLLTFFIGIFSTQLYAQAITNKFPENGNVGIGTTDPERKLTVYGSSNVIAQFGLDYTNRISLYQNLSDKSGSIYYYANSWGKLHLGRHNNNESPTMTIDAPKNYVGIGTQLPFQKLSVIDGQIFLGTSSTNQTESGRLRFSEFINSFQGAFIHYDGDLNNLNIGVHNTNDTDVNNDIKSISIRRSNGNVGIGTTSPDQKLTVQGIIRSQSSSSNFVNNFFVSSDGNCYMNYAGGSTSSRVGFQIDGSSKASIHNNGNFVVHSGNVGIGYSNPTYKLSVNGIISATEVKVSTTPNSDYVFEPDYNLRSLEEVNSFIQQNKHLPDIPSAEEFKETGVGLGEMDDMLLRKIEELTLYMIELKKENEELKISSQELKEENLSLKTNLLKEIETIKALLK